MLYAVKCYWPGITQADLERVADRAAGAGLVSASNKASYFGSLLFAADDLVLCLFYGPSRASVIQASDQLGIPCERLMEPVWLSPDQRSPQGARILPAPTSTKGD
jgi:hypothetical protein